MGYVKRCPNKCSYDVGKLNIAISVFVDENPNNQTDVLCPICGIAIHKKILKDERIDIKNDKGLIN